MPVKYKESIQGFKDPYQNEKYMNSIKERISKLQNLSQKDLLQAFSTNTDFLDRSWRYGRLNTQTRQNQNYHTSIENAQRDQIKEDYNTNYEKTHSIISMGDIAKEEILKANNFLVKELNRSEEDLKRNSYILDSENNNNIEYMSKEGVFIFTYNNEEKNREIPENYKKLMENYENGGL